MTRRVPLMRLLLPTRLGIKAGDIEPQLSDRGSRSTIRGDPGRLNYWPIGSIVGK